MYQLDHVGRLLPSSGAVSRAAAARHAHASALRAPQGGPRRRSRGSWLRAPARSLAVQLLRL